MTLVLQWRQMPSIIVTRWRGPDGSLAVSALSVPVPPLPTIIGPSGAAGPPGPQGPIADIIDAGTFN